MKKKISFILVLILLISYIFSFNFETLPVWASANNSINQYVYPIGKTIGLKLYTNGVLVIGMSEIEDNSGIKHKPYEGKDIKEGDMIKSINGNEISNTNQLVELLNSYGEQEVSIKYQRDNDEMYTTIKPVKIDNNYMLGLWVRDAAAGIGTLTYYNKANSSFAALGHGIQDVDTEKLLNISNGEIVTCNIISIVKGKKGMAGELRGTIDNSTTIGKIYKNSNLGVYGTVTNLDYIKDNMNKEVKVANRNEIKIGKAKIYCCIDNKNVEEYEIKIKKIYKNNSRDNKSMLVELTDKRLLEKTGGIIQGMSGSPIIQDNKFVGAITNVLLNRPTEGYAIFADLMLEQ